MANKSDIVAFEKKAKEKNKEISKIDFDRLGITEFRGEKVAEEKDGRIVRVKSK